jgi:hypothetical protein
VQVRPVEQSLGFGVDFLSLAVFSRRVLRNLTSLAKDGSYIVAYHQLGIFDYSEPFVDYTRRRG